MPSSVEAWQDGMSEQLLEAARVVRRGGRAVVRVAGGRLGTKPVNYREQVSAVLQSCMPTYWQVEGTIVERYAKGAGSGRDTAAELIVLRRK
jgi:hypothetical protein